ncbi:response regulator [Chloroflexota bacterium]
MKSPDSSSRKTILLVEDEPSITSVCCRALTNKGFEVDVGINGKVAQSMIEKKQYDLCLIDMRTPIMDGEELYVWLLQEHPQMARKVIFTTGDVMGGEITGFIERSGMPFLPKPFTPDQLQSVVSSTLKSIEND